MLVALVMFGGDGGYRVTATFENAGQLVKGNQVRVGGRAVGTITRIELNDSAQAVVEMSVEDDVAPLHTGTDATIRATSLSGIANRYVSLRPGPNDAGEIDSGGSIGADDTTAPVDLDQLFNALDPGARKGLQQVIKGQADWYQGRGADAARSLKYFAPALNSTSRLTRELVVDDEVFSKFVTDTSAAMGAIAERRDDLSGLVQNTGTALGAIGDENVALARALDLLPGTLRKSNTTFVNLRAALDDLDVLVEESKTGTRDLAPFLRRLRPLLADARPTIRDLRTLIRTPGANNDLLELTGKLPRLQRLTSTVFPRANRTFDRSQEFVDTLRQYTPDLAGWFTKFGQVASAYDANGHYARIQPVVGLFDYDEDTGVLPASPTPSASTDSARASSGAARAAPCSPRRTARRRSPWTSVTPTRRRRGAERCDVW